MKKSFKILSVFVFAMLMQSCINDMDNIDNYTEPDCQLTGYFIDSETNQPVPLPVEGESGVKLRLFEKERINGRSVDFYAQKNGLFNHSRLFSNTYNLVLEQTPFYPLDTLVIDVKKVTERDIMVTPYCRISAEAIPAGKSIQISSVVSRERNDYKMQERVVLWHYSPNLDQLSINNSGKTSQDLQLIDDEEIINTPYATTLDLENDPVFVEKLNVIKANQNQIYIRVGIKTNGSYNYSEIIPVQLNL
ncbi:DUF3823 domain-containing protein [Sunxiuqinia sp. A32]|uniref:DUF3823 domain-containing protein n=1 Tax=Sunxiuqinia sp. A32 TaxID=3461496 RepID=UPI00404573E5